MVDSEQTNLASQAKSLSEIQAALRNLEAQTLSTAASDLARAAEKLLLVTEKLKEEQPTEWMSHEETARYLRTTPDALYKLAAAGTIRREKVGGKYLYSRKDVDAAVRSGERNGG